MLCKLLCLLLISFGFSEQPTLTVGAKRFLENEVLGEIIAQQVEKLGVTWDQASLPPCWRTTSRARAWKTNTWSLSSCTTRLMQAMM